MSYWDTCGIRFGILIWLMCDICVIICGLCAESIWDIVGIMFVHVEDSVFAVAFGLF